MKRPAAMKCHGGAFIVLLVLLCLPSGAFSADVTGRSRTLLTARETVLEENIVRLYEYVDLSSYNIGDNGLSVHASGWGRYDLDTPAEDDRDEGELSYAYLDVPTDVLHARLRLGRQFVFAGVASEQVDGISIAADVSGFEAALFGGSPPELDIDDRRGDSIYGGRLSHRVNGIYELGASYLKEANDGEDFRTEYGADLWLSPVAWLALKGSSIYNEETSDWMEHTYRLDVGGTGRLSAYGEYSAIDYEHFFQTATTTAFSRMLLDPQESYTSWGGGLGLMLTGSLNVSARYKRYDYEVADAAVSYGAGASFAGKVLMAGVSGDRMDNEADELSYTQYRLFVSAAGQRADIALDLSTVQYDAEQEGTDKTITAIGTLGYRPTKGLRTGLDVTYEENPLFNHETRVLLKIDYQFGGI